MNDNQEEQLGMAVKVKDFLAEHAADLAGVTQIASLQGVLNSKIDAITVAEGELSADYTGDAKSKADIRERLKAMTHHVGVAASAYYFSIGLSAKVKAADYSKRELTLASGSALYEKSKRIFEIAGPVSALLAAYNSGPADVTELNTRKEKFFESIQKPRDNRDYRNEQKKLMEKLFKEMKQTLLSLDIYMATFENGAPVLFSQYRNRRAIDN